MDNLALLLQQVAHVAPCRYPRVTDLLLQLPTWLRTLGTPDGIAQFERDRRVVVPQPLRLYFACPAVACWLRIRADTDTFLDDASFSDPPPIVRWSGESYLVIGDLPHSQVQIAGQLNCDEPALAWGCVGDTRALPYPPMSSVSWLSRIACKIIEQGPP